MYSNNILIFQESKTILNACKKKKKVWKLIEYSTCVCMCLYIILTSLLKSTCFRLFTYDQPYPTFHIYVLFTILIWYYIQWTSCLAFTNFPSTTNDGLDAMLYTVGVLILKTYFQTVDPLLHIVQLSDESF